MTSITERSHAISGVFYHIDPGSGKTWMLPHPWASEAVDRLICSLDSADAEPSEMVHLVKKQFPELANYAILPEVLENRIRILDQRLDVDYFKPEPEQSNVSDAYSLMTGQTISRHQNENISNQHMAPRKEPQMVHSSKLSLDGTVDLNTPDIPDSAIEQALGDPGAERRLTMTSILSTMPEGPLDVVDPAAEGLLCAIEENREAEAEEEEDVTLHPDTLGARHGLAIHKDKGEAWETVKPDKKFARDRSVRRIIIEEEETRDRAIKHGLAIHSNHGEKWERIRIGDPNAPIKKRDKGKGKARRHLHSVDLQITGQENVENLQENDMPTALKVNGAIVGLAPSGTIKSVHSIRSEAPTEQDQPRKSKKVQASASSLFENARVASEVKIEAYGRASRGLESSIAKDQVIVNGLSMRYVY